MNSSNRTSNIKTRLVSALVVAALILCAVISFGFINIPRVGLADDETDVKAVHGIRFAQVAAGEDFAIGLTPDGQLYGWSLLASRANETTFANTSLDSVNTLGRYYPGIPAKLNVKFYAGPGRNDASPQYWSQDAYHAAAAAGEQIKTIVATRTTAAFITKTGFIYTWGKDADKVSSIENAYYEEREQNPHYLLLRNLDDTRDNWYQPYIINYNYYNTDTNEGGATVEGNPIRLLCPGSGGISDMKIAAGEYSYTVVYTSSGSTYVYTWGTLMYSLPNTDDTQSATTSNFDHDYVQSTGNIDMQGGMSARKVLRLPAGVTVSSVAAGGYTIALNASAATTGSTSLMLRGRNFINTINPTAVTGTNVNAVKTTALTADSGSSNAKYHHTDGEYMFTEAIAGAALKPTETTTAGVVTVATADLNKYYARQGYSTSLKFTATPTAAIGTNGVSSIPENANTAVCYDVSLGNDVGYGLTEEGNLYAWGDNTYGQLTTTVADKNSTAPRSIMTGIASIAAGKQLSANNKPLNVLPALIVEDGTWKFNPDTTTGDVTVQGVQNRPEFITGAVGKDGKLRVWNNVIKSPVTLAYGVAGNGASATVTDSNMFVAAYSGYGNNLFAVTKIGKLVRITYDADANAFVQTRYDRFLDYTVATDGSLVYNTVKNWDVNSGNSISFAPTAAPTKAKVNPDYVPATVYVWSATAAVVTADDKPVDPQPTTGSVNAGFDPLVTVNNIGDAYRILTEADDDLLATSGTRKLLSATLGTAPETFKPVFKFDGEVMSGVQQANMFSYTYVTDENGKGITISPLQSSKGKVITAEFYVARYANYDDFTASADNALYYDYLPCSFTFTIADTPSVLYYDAYAAGEGETTGNSNIPLLDPNNANNSSYSIAVQDVSGGFDALNRFLTGYSATADIPTTNPFKKAILDFVDKESVDKGFPASRKISEGHLDYYLGADTAKYNNKYQYLFADRDSDRIIVDPTSGVRLMSSGSGVNGSAIGRSKLTITVTLDLSTSKYGIKSDFTDAATDYADINKKIAKEFNNFYGLYDIAFNADKTSLSFKYDIITFTATGTTGNIQYDLPAGATESTENRGVSSYITTSVNPHIDVIVNANTVTAYDKSYNSQYSATDATTFSTIRMEGAVAGLFSQASLRLNKVKDPTGAHYGMSDGSADSEHNRLTVTIDEALYVGNSRTIRLSEYVDGSGADGKIYFSYNNSTSNYTAFNNQFSDSTGGNRSIVKLDGANLTVEPTVAAPLNIEVAIQRFATSTGLYFVAPSPTGAGYLAQEKIFITFIFTNIRGFTFERGENTRSSFVIKQPTTIDILAGGTIDGVSYAAFGAIKGLDADTTAKKNIEDKVTITNVQTSAPSVFSVDISEVQRHSINIKPLISGTGKVQLIATVYGESVIISFTVNVAYLTILGNNDLISLIDDEYVYIDSLDTKLQEDNSFVNFEEDKYHIIYNDVKDQKDTAGKNIYNAIYFTTDPTSKTDVGYPEFIRSVTFESVDTQPYIRIEPSTSTVSDATTYYMHVRYTDMQLGDYDTVEERGGSILEIVVPVVSGKVAINLGTDAVIIDTKSTRSEGSKIWFTRGSNLNTVAVISPKELLDYVGNIEATGDYRVFKVSAATEAAKYFNYTFNNSNQVEITPLLNTPKDTAYALNVYVYNPRVDSNNTRVLTFNVEIKGILTVLPVSGDGKTLGYGEIWLYSFIIVFGVLAIIFVVRLIVYWKKRAKQRAIIKRNQELIRLRDRMHNKATAASREQIVRTKLKMEDPRYAKIFNDMRKDKEEESGISLDNSDLAATASKKAKKAKKKKGGKKTVAELKAELEAKRAAFASAQANAQPVNPFETEVPIDGAAFVAPDGDYAGGDGGFAGDGTFGGDGDFAAQDIGGDIVFDASDMGDGM